ncbi:MAG: autotransporter-associated beta strand repeat-containing protein [Verrucomicrobiota bacterium]
MNAKRNTNQKRSLTTLWVVLGLAIAISATAQTTYNNTATGNWSDPASWTGSQPPVGGSADAIIDLAGTGLLATNDLSGAFTLNKLAVTTGSGSLYSQGGSTLSFVLFGGAQPVITNVVGAGLSLYSPISLANNLTVGASAATTLYSNITESAVSALTKAGIDILYLGGSNTYSGNTTVNAGSLSVMNGGSIFSPAATLNVANGNFTNAGSISVKTLLATNNTATTTGSIFAFGGSSSLTTSNLNGLAARIVLPPSYTNNVRYNVNGVWNMNAGTNLVVCSTNLPYLAVSANSTINVNPNAYLSLPGSTATNMLLYVGDAASGGKLVVNGGMVSGIRGINMGANAANSFNSIIITNGGSIIPSGPGLASWLIANAAGSTSNTFAIYGANSIADTVGTSFFLQNSGVGGWNRLTVDAGVLTNVSALYVANINGTNDTIVVTNSGQIYCTNTLNIGLGAGCNNNAIYVYTNSKIENLTASASSTAINMAQNGNAFGNSLNINGGTVKNFSAITIGASSKTNINNNGIYVSNGGQISAVTAASLFIGYNGSSNTLSLVDAGTVGRFPNGATLYIGRSLGGSTNAVGNSLIVSNGAQFSVNTVNIGYANNLGAAVSNNYAVVGGGVGNSILSPPNALNIGATAGVTNSYLNLLTGGIISNTLNINIGITGSGGSRLNINGGTIVASASGTGINLFADGKVYIQSGGATFDTSLGGLTLRPPCLEDPSSPGGGLTKFGASTLTFTNANTYTGQTTIGSGTLALGGSFATLANTTNISIADGATFSLAYSLSTLVPTEGAIDYTLTSGQTLSCSTNSGKAYVVTTNTLAAVQKMLTLAPGAKLAFKADGLAVTNGEIVVNGDLTLNHNAISVNVENAALPPGNYHLLACVNSGSLANSGTFGAPTITGMGVSGTASINVVTGPNGYVELQVVASGPTTGTNIQAGVSGNTLNLTWPGSYKGWYMESNSVSLTSASDWHSIPGSELVTNLAIPMDTSKTNVFFRMRKP